MKFATAALLVAAVAGQEEEKWEESYDDWYEDDGAWMEDEWDPCACLGYDALPTDFFEEQGYGEYYGSSCTNWDASEDYCQEGGSSYGEEWCDWDYSWCYVDPMCYDSEPTEYFEGTDYEDMLNWRECDGDDDWQGSGAGKIVATFATAFAVASIAM